jgi:hypothetical protein
VVCDISSCNNLCNIIFEVGIMFSEERMQEIEDGLQSSHHIETICEKIRRFKRKIKDIED